MGPHSAVVVALFVVVASLIAVVVVVAPLTAVVGVASWLFGFCHRFIVLPPTDCGQFIVWSPQLPVPTDLGKREGREREREVAARREREAGVYRGAVGWAGNHVICRLMKIYDMKAAK